MNNNDYIIKGETLSTIADGIRRVTGVSEDLTPPRMAEVMSAAEPGSGSGNSGEVETCKLTINAVDWPEMSDGFISYIDFTLIHYTNKNN